MSLTTPDRVEALLGRSLTDDETSRVTTLLSMASDQVVGAIGQTFTQATTTERLSCRNGEVWWPQRPVTAVSAVVVDPDGGDVTLSTTQYDFDTQRLRLSRYPYQVDPFRSPFSTPAIRDLHNFSGLVSVTYTHGYATIPGDVQNAVAGAVAALVQQQTTNPSGIRSESLDDHTIQFHFRDGTSLAVALDIGADVLEELEENYGISAWSPRVG